MRLFDVSTVTMHLSFACRRPAPESTIIRALPSRSRFSNVSLRLTSNRYHAPAAWCSCSSMRNKRKIMKFDWLLKLPARYRSTNMPAHTNEMYVSVEEYLASEERSMLRHEYVDGRLFAMADSTLKHNILSGNLFSLLHAKAKNGQCRVFIHAVKVRVEATNSFYYPDVMVYSGFYG
ncbi:MAG: hypothetical protein C0469_09015 [Cyanobacteria bacterium DS2.3.42]|nr:hypothetical protein [Cyanobacteria bacterium DS2.3.42]